MRMLFVPAVLLGFLPLAGAQSTPSTPPAPHKAFRHGSIDAPAHWAQVKSQGQSHLDAAPPPGSTLVYDSYKRLSKVLEPDAQGNPTIETDYEYDAHGKVTSITQLGAKGDAPRIRTFHYDENSRLLDSTSPEAGKLSYTYDAAGNIATKTDANGTTVTYTWDGKKRLVKKQYSDGTPDAHFTYTGNDHSLHSWVVVDNARRYERRYHIDEHEGIDVIAQRFPATEKIPGYVYVIRLGYGARGVSLPSLTLTAG